MIKFTWYCPHPTHYHDFLFEKLNELKVCELQIIYFNKILSKYPWKNRKENAAKSSILKKGKLGVDFNFLCKRKRADYHLIAGWAEPTMVLFLSYLWLSSSNYIIYTDTPKPRSKKGIREWLRAKWLHSILKKAKAILVTGEAGVNMVKSWPVGSTPVYNFPFVTDLDFFQPKSFRTFAVPIVFFSSGRLAIGHKGYNIALHALARLKREQPQLNFLYKIAGTGPDEIAIKEMATDLNLKNNIEFLGWKEIEELPTLYNSADIFLHPSFIDPFPNAILEAMACGCIVIASKSAGSASERIDDCVNGFLFNSGDFNQLFLVIKQVLALNNEKQLTIKRNARLTAEKWPYGYNASILNRIIDDCD